MMKVLIERFGRYLRSRAVQSCPELSRVHLTCQGYHTPPFSRGLQATTSRVRRTATFLMRTLQTAGCWIMVPSLQGKKPSSRFLTTKLQRRSKVQCSGQKALTVPYAGFTPLFSQRTWVIFALGRFNPMEHLAYLSLLTTTAIQHRGSLHLSCCLIYLALL